MNGDIPFTIEQFYSFIGKGKLMGGRCAKCGKIHLPPRSLCSICLSEKMQWTEMPEKGRLLTYTIIHVAPPKFKEMTPYAVGIIQLENGVKIPGMIRTADLEQINIGVEMKVAFDNSSVESQWPQWPTYYFEPVT